MITETWMWVLSMLRTHFKSRTLIHGDPNPGCSRTEEEHT